MSRQSVTVLGATGSIGVNTLDVIRRHRERFAVFALCANSQVDRLFGQIREFAPKFAVVRDAALADELLGGEGIGRERHDPQPDLRSAGGEAVARAVLDGILVDVQGLQHLPLVERRRVSRGMGLGTEQLADLISDALIDSKVVGLFQGRFEWGPRALGNRSILADPRRAEMKNLVNVKIKFREPFRPFAPVVPEERAAEYFDLGRADGQYPQRFMLMVSPVLPDKQEQIPAVSHMGTGRLQTIRREWNPRYYDIVDAFGQKTGVPVLMNTSFNLRGEPIVTSPANAFNTFSKSDIDLLVLERFVVRK